MMSGSGRPALTTGWTFEMGRQERQVVRIEKERPPVLAAFRRHTYRVFVNGQFVQECVG
jgi:hypothetical protein